ncbi:TetR/AcrR family transcriptional regulator [Streptomyces oceani]|uniref:TetR family transcriptional regulator n=1 Tax=Streptomyces oceani TaxID=1075402 RepID=A0A1E7KME0_9ACTN|nr:TetR/AcrR family transcriptional regulator [Streptomyces oceani]OEV05078.1 TetR family transcriptional regulator [Streptomyces oceani]
MTTAQSGGGDLQRGLELLWGLKEAPTRGPKPGLTLERIVSAGVSIADAEGLEALSMRRVATELGVGTMSLYRYVPGKSELLELMLDHVSEEANPGDLRELDWRAVLEAYGHGAWRMHLAHPWLLQVNLARPLLGPRAMAGFDQVIGGLAALGLSDQERLMLLGTVESHVAGSARAHVNALLAAQRTGVSDEDFWDAQRPFLSQAMASGGFPALEQLDPGTFDVTGEQIFEFGLVRLLDGIGEFIKSREAARGE